MAARAALVGRASELARAGAALRDATVAGVVVGGGAGVGKTRLAMEIVRLAEERGLVTSTAFATRAASSVPLGALAPLLPPLGSGREVNVDALGRAVRALEARAREGRLLLLVDDAHVLDDASAAVVHQVATGTDVFVVATMRTGEGGPDSIDALRDHDRMVRIDLGPLDREATRQCVAGLLGGVVAGGTAHRLWGLSRGNPLLLRELVLGGSEAGLFVEDAGVWRILATSRASPRLVSVVEARLADVDADQRAALEAVVLGEPLGFGLLADMADPHHVEALERRGLVTVTLSGRRREVRLAHPLHGEVLRSELPAVRSMAVHRALYERVLATGARRREDVLRVAVWALESGGEVDEGLMLEAGRSAYYSNDTPLAERLARVAVQAGGGVEAQQVLGEVLASQGRHEEAAQILADAAAQPVNDRQRALLAMTHSALLFWGLDRGRAAGEVLEAAAARISEASWRDELVGQRATYELLEGRATDALALVQPMLEHADGRPFVEAAIAAVPALAIIGRGEEACALADRAFAAHSVLGDQAIMSHPGLHMAAKCVALGEMGELRAAEQLAALGYEAAVQASAVDGQAWFSLLLGRALCLRRPREALRWFREAAALYGSMGQNGPRRWALAGGAFAAATVGEEEVAGPLMREADGLGDVSVKMMASDVARARAWTAAVAGDPAGARRQLRDACSIAREREVLALEVAALHDCVRLGDHAAVVDRLEEVASHVAGRLAAVRAGHARALAAGDRTSVGAAADSFEELGATVLAAEAAAQAAALSQADGSNRAAARWAQRARALASEAEGAATPAMALAGDGSRLTRRELEAAQFAARGLHNKDIAREMGVSVRTVENHLLRAYEKLGVAGREALTAALH